MKKRLFRSGVALTIIGILASYAVFKLAALSDISIEFEDDLL